MRGRGDASPLTIGAMSDLLFPISWTSDPRIIKGVDTCVPSPLNQEVIQIFKCFRSLDTYTLISRDHEYVNGIKDYFGIKEFLLVLSRTYYFICADIILFL